MAYLLNGIVYVPVQTPRPAQVTQETETAGLITSNSKHTQTYGLRKPVELNEKLASIIGYLTEYPSLQCRLLQWGQYSQYQAVEIT